MSLRNVYAAIKAVQKENQRIERESTRAEKSLRYLLAARERLLSQILPRDAAGHLLPEKKWSRGVRRWWNENEKAIEWATKNQEQARQRIQARQEVLAASIRTEGTYRADKLETRRRQQEPYETQSFDRRFDVHQSCNRQREVGLEFPAGLAGTHG